MNWSPISYQLRNVVPSDILDKFIESIYKTQWIYGVPGGFLTNTPKRYVYTYGDGGEISLQDDIIISNGWDSTYWTAKVNKNNVTLQSQTNKMPPEFASIIPYLRSLFYQTIPNANITNNTFNIAVCNYYTEFDMNIAEHDDANDWYPSDITNYDVPFFASITLYPFSKPTDKKQYARFQIKSPYNFIRNTKCGSGGNRDLSPVNKSCWQDVLLGHESVMIMPSTIKHRVMAHTKSNQSIFLPRINITFRSTYSSNINPLMNAMAVANHARYYSIPKQLIFSSEIDYDIINGYNQLLSRYNKQILVNIINIDRSKIKSTYKKYYQEYIRRNNLMKINKYTANMTMELIQIVCIYLSTK